MGDKSKISWTDALRPVSPLMARAAERLYVEPMGRVMAEVVVIFSGRATAVETRKARRSCKQATADCCTHRVGCSIFSPGRARREHTSPANSYAAAIEASRSEAIGTTSICIEQDRLPPCLAFRAALLASLQREDEVLLNADASVRGHSLQRAFGCTGHLSEIRIPY